MVFGKFKENINAYGFVFGDLKYFDWFKSREHFEDNEINRFRNALVWKRLIYYAGDDNFRQTWRDFQSGQFNAYPVVSRAFLNHLKNPLTFPIFDKHVWKAMRMLNPDIANRTPENPKDIEFEPHYLREYQAFFNHLYEENNNNFNAPQISGVDEQIVKRRVLDRALWLYGKILTGNQRTQVS
jgi:hypothetical protein